MLDLHLLVFIPYFNSTMKGSLVMNRSVSEEQTYDVFFHIDIDEIS